jgi:general secretion pathway protein D
MDMKTFMTSLMLVLLSAGAVDNLADKNESKADPNAVIVQTQTQSDTNEPNSLGSKKVSLNFKDASLSDIVGYLSEFSGLVIVADDVVLEQKVTVISKQPMGIEEAISLINTVLKENGFAAVKAGRFLRVVSIAKAKTMNIRVTSGSDPKSITPSDEVITHVVPVRYVDVVALKENLTPLIPEYASLEANKDGNSLIITDTTSNIRRLMEIIQAIDTHMSTVTEIRVFRLINADATSATNLINNLFRQQQGGTTQTQQGGGFRGPMEMMMQQIQQGARGGRGSGSDSSQQQRGGANVAVVAAADTQTNSVVVRGPTDTLNIIQNMIKALDDRTAKVADVRVFQLRYADAMNTADVINQLFGQTSATSGRGTQGNVPFFFRGGPGGPGGIGAATQQEEAAGSFKVTAAADSRTNTVVVTGPESVLEVVAGVIKSLDSPLSNVADVKVFHLQYADAQDTSSLINEVFGQSRTSSTRSTRSTSQQSQQIQFMRGGFGGPGGQQTTQGVGTTSDVVVVASADSRTNSVVVSGPPETLVVIAQIIKQLDENPAQERRIFVYALKNANSTNLMTILNNLFTEMQALNQQVTGGRTGLQGGQRNVQSSQVSTGGGQGSSSSMSATSTDISEQTYFQADPNTNSLLIMTSSKNYEKIKPIIEDLDKPVGQVLIKVLFAEVTHSNSVDLGSEFSMLNLRSSGGSTNTTQVFGKPTSLLTEGGASKSMGLSLRTLEGDIDFTLRALQETGKLNILSRPYVLTRNNQKATITVAEEVPIPTSSTSSTGGAGIGTQTSFDYRKDIGIVLEVTPSINPEGLVNMVVAPKITTRTGETVQISESLSPVVFATRSASTMVAVLNGQTIVIGGLIEDQIKDTIKKVPILGDIPIIDLLFKRSVKQKTKTELLIFLTPFVAQKPEELTAISEEEQSRSNIEADKSSAEIFKKHIEAMKSSKTADKPQN